jgi:spore germination protein
MSIRSVVVASLLSLLAGSLQAAYRVAVWIPTWDDNALTTVQRNAGAISESNPVWYSWNADGSIARNWNAENPALRAAMTGTQLMPSIQNFVAGSFNGTVVKNVLATASSRDAHASAIFGLVTSNAFDGIDIDYESVPTASRADFTAFVSTLAQKLHGAGKKLSVTVYAKTSDKQNWEGPGAQDFAAIGQQADTVKIMAYDYSWDGSAAGPITPLVWLDQVVGYAESVIPPAKVIVGLPFYGYDWVGSKGRGASYPVAMQAAQAHGVAISRDANGEPWFAYDDHVVYFQDATSYAKKVEAIKQKHPGIGGFAHWAAGQEDPAIWNVIKSAGSSTGGGSGTGSGGSGATPLPPDFSVDGPSVLTVQQGSAVSADYRLVAINGFNARAAVAVQSLSPGFTPSLTTSAPGVTPASSVRVTLAAGREITPGAYQVAVRFTSASLVHEQVVSVVVKAAAASRTRSASH